MTISETLRRDLDRLVGHRFDDSVLKRLAEQIKTELRASEVKIKAIRGTEPNHLIVDFEVKPERYGLNVATISLQLEGRLDRGWQRVRESRWQ